MSSEPSVQSRELAAALDTLRYAATGGTERTEMPSRQAAALLAKLEAADRPKVASEPVFLIFYEDHDRRPEVFMLGGNDEAAARHRFEQVLSRGWNAHLFQRIDDGKRPAEYRAPQPVRGGEQQRPRSPTLSACQAGMDGECNDTRCPQERDGEPIKTGRSCPLPHWSDNRS